MRYALGDRISCVDLNGKVYRIVIQSISEYNIARQFQSLEILAMQYPAPYDTIDKETTKFYICATIKDVSSDVDIQSTNIILWDDIIDHEKTVYLTAKSVYRLDILPISLIDGAPVKDIGSIIADIKKAISDNVEGVVITYTDITDAEEDELTQMKKAVAYAKEFLMEVKETESIRPLIQDLLAINFETLTTDITNMLTSIQSRLALIDSGTPNTMTSQVEY